MKQARQDAFITCWKEYAKGTVLEAILPDFYPLLYFYSPKKGNKAGYYNSVLILTRVPEVERNL